MQLVLHIFQGVGVAAAIGIRPFFPSLAAGAIAAADIELDLTHTSYSFLQSVPFLLAMLILGVLWIAADRGPWQAALHSRVGLGLSALIALALGALFCAGSMVRGGHPAWPGLIVGVVCAGLGLFASRPFLARLATRLQAADVSGSLPLIAEGSALLAAVLSILAPGFGVLLLIALAVLAYRGRGAADAKYAGLRILR